MGAIQHVRMTPILFTLLTFSALSSTSAVAADLAAEEACSTPCLEYSGSLELNAA